MLHVAEVTVRMRVRWVSPVRLPLRLGDEGNDHRRVRGGFECGWEANQLDQLRTNVRMLDAFSAVENPERGDKIDFLTRALAWTP